VGQRGKVMIFGRIAGKCLFGIERGQYNINVFAEVRLETRASVRGRCFVILSVSSNKMSLQVLF
jgi:hypothetical protein